MKVLNYNDVVRAASRRGATLKESKPFVHSDGKKYTLVQVICAGFRTIRGMLPHTAQEEAAA